MGVGRDDDGTDELRVTVMGQRTMFVKDLPMLLARGAERAQQGGYTVQYKRDRQQSPMSGWWIARADGAPFQQSEIQWLIQTIRRGG